MSDNPLIGPIEGYTVAVFKHDGDRNIIVDEFDLRLTKVGGAQVQGFADLIMQIEDAVFKQEQKDAKYKSG